jgi:uncharacterized protein
MILLLLVPAFLCLAGAYWYLAQGKLAIALRLQHAGGGVSFAITVIGWYIFFSVLLASVDFPLQLPLGNPSTVVPGAGNVNKAKKVNAGQTDDNR